MPTFRWTNESVVELEANSSVHPIHGEIRDLRGETVVDVQDGKIQLETAKGGFIEADVETLKSGNKLEDMELRRRLEVKKYPTMRYEVRSAEGGPENFKVTGALTFHGVTREVVEEVTAQPDGDAIVISGEHTFDIRDFDVKPPKILKLQVYPEVKIKVRLVGRPA
ncbi:MAG: YceI family protein [Actinomycetota bacterium]|nr:YceI family protein [Actinomycetota bacterium]